MTREEEKLLCPLHTIKYSELKRDARIILFVTLYIYPIHKGLHINKARGQLGLINKPSCPNQTDDLAADSHQRHLRMNYSGTLLAVIF